MNKSTKGAVAAGAAAVLLLGGAGSLAYWNAEGTIGGGSINAGNMELVNPTGGTWSLNGGAPVTDVSTVRIVPGDTLVFTGSWTIDAKGNNLEATIDAEGIAATGGLADEVTITDTYTVAGAPATTITEDNDTDVLTATITVDLPYEAGVVNNDAMTLSLDLTDVNVTLTQQEPTP